MAYISKSGSTKIATYAFKIASKRAIHKTDEATGDLIGNYVADKITMTTSPNTLIKSVMPIQAEDVTSKEK